MILYGNWKLHCTALGLALLSLFGVTNIPFKALKESENCEIFVRPILVHHESCKTEFIVWCCFCKLHKSTCQFRIKCNSFGFTSFWGGLRSMQSHSALTIYGNIRCGLFCDIPTQSDGIAQYFVGRDDLTTQPRFNWWPLSHHTRHRPSDPDVFDRRHAHGVRLWGIGELGGRSAKTKLNIVDRAINDPKSAPH